MVLYILTFTFLDSRRDDKRLDFRYDKKFATIFTKSKKLPYFLVAVVYNTQPTNLLLCASVA
jgi:hypothetical protein